MKYTKLRIVPAIGIDVELSSDEPIITSMCGEKYFCSNCGKTIEGQHARTVETMEHGLVVSYYHVFDCMDVDNAS